MTEKEEKALKIFKHWIEYEKANKEKINKADELIEIQETVLKALEQKDKELAEERIKYISSNLNNTIKQRQKEDEQLNALNEGWKIELEQKDKEIQELKADLYECNNIISDYIDTVKEKDKIIDVIVQEYEYNAGINVKDFCKEEMRKDKCIQDCRCCIKKFFERKVREGNE